jgi:serine/threonine protein kinase
MEMFCPLCSRVYNEGAKTCEADGEKLVLLTEEPSLVGHVLDGKYTLLSKLGEGGMGSVYLAEQATMGREVAIKVLRREFSQNRMAIKRFLREARAASKLAHHNTITVYDFGQSNQGLLYLVMERLSGRPLADVLDEEGPLAVERAVHIFSQICDSLAEAHQQGITHRDLKPENIFIEDKFGSSEFVKVLDFGIAKMQGDEATSQATATGMICGTPSYMSPEQAMGKDIDGRSDIYALGVLLFEMVTNEKPFDGATPMEVMLKHINERPPDMFERTGVAVSDKLQEAIHQLLAKKPQDRPDDCQAAKRLVQAAAKAPPKVVAGPSPEGEGGRKRRDEAEERGRAPEKTGIAPAASVSEVVSSPRTNKRPVWIWPVIGVALAAGIVAALWSAKSGDGLREEAARETKVANPAPEEASRESTPPNSGTTSVKAPSNPPGTVAPQENGDAPLAGQRAGEVVADGGELAAQASTRVVIRLEGEPRGAEVFEGETPLGVLPIELTRARGGSPIALQVRARGHYPENFSVDLAGHSLHRVELKKVAPSQRKPQVGDKPNFGTF